MSISLEEYLRATMLRNFSLLWQYQTFDNAKAWHFMDELMTMRNDDMNGVHEYILKMVHFQIRLKALDIPIPDKFIVQ